jgi:outer membrane protein assembly factor BamB
MNGTLQAVQPDGSLLWRYLTGCEYLLASPVCDARGDCYVGDPNGVVHQVTRQGAGQVLFEAPRSIQARPAFDPQGRLYVPCGDRRVHILSNA